MWTKIFPGLLLLFFSASSVLPETPESLRKVGQTVLTNQNSADFPQTATKFDVAGEATFNEAKAGWKELRNLIFSGKGRVEERSIGFDTNGHELPGQHDGFWEEVVNSNAGMVRSVKRWTGNKSTEYVVCLNPEYGFSLSKRTRDSDFLVHQVRTHGRDQKICDDLEVSSSWLSPLKILGAPLDWLFDQPGVKMTSITRVAGEDDRRPEVVRISFTGDATKLDDFIPSGGWVEVDPQRCYAIVDYELKGMLGTAIDRKTQHLFRGRLKYRKRSTATLSLLDVIPESVEIAQDTLDGKPFVLTTYNFRDVDQGDLQLRDCQLKAFGFSEPAMENELRASQRGFVKWNLIAAILFGSGLGLYGLSWRYGNERKNATT